MMRQPFFSIIVAAYNSSATISRTIQSVLAQSFVDFELLIIDDGSTDETVSVVEKFKDERLRYLSKENGGPSQARNFGSQAANGLYFIFLDSDDWLGTNFLEACYARLSSCESPLALCGIIEVNNADGRELKSISPWRTADNFGPFLCGSYVVSARAYKNVDGFDGNLFYSENSDLYLRLKRKFNHHEMIQFIPEAKVYISRQDHQQRNLRYSKKKYASITYFLKKHREFFDQSTTDFLNFKRQHALGALQNNELSEARRSIMEVIKRSPLSIKSYFQYFLFCFPAFARMYYKM